jgi:hypothetical protein
MMLPIGCQPLCATLVHGSADEPSSGQHEDVAIAGDYSTLTTIAPTVKGSPI